MIESFFFFFFIRSASGPGFRTVLLQSTWSFRQSLEGLTQSFSWWLLGTMLLKGLNLKSLNQVEKLTVTRRPTAYGDFLQNMVYPVLHWRYKSEQMQANPPITTSAWKHLINYQMEVTAPHLNTNASPLLLFLFFSFTCKNPLLQHIWAKPWHSRSSCPRSFHSCYFRSETLQQWRSIGTLPMFKPTLMVYLSERSLVLMAYGRKYFQAVEWTLRSRSAKWCTASFAPASFSPAIQIFLCFFFHSIDWLQLEIWLQDSRRQR